ncbi:MAG: hypothetical protein U0176_01045 [Bacteroidia bacterium]
MAIASPKSKAAFYIFASLPLVYFLLFGFHGMDAADRGFIPALAYRILGGEVIYRDFFYVRPPLTPYLHTLEMALLPDTWEMIGYRLVYYVFMWLPIYWSIRALERYVDFGKMGVSPWILGAMGYALSLHNFFAAPWHTVDGIFFAALGFYAMTRSSRPLHVGLGLFCLGLSALTKQPFGVVPFIGVGLAVFLHGWRQGLLGTVVTAGLAGIGFAVVEFALTPGYSFFSEMLAQITGSTSLNEMRWGGYQLYIRPAVIAFGPGLVIWLVLKFAFKKSFNGWPMAIYTLLGLVAVGAGMLAVTIQYGGFVQPKTGFIHALVFCGGAIAGLTFIRRDRKAMALLLAMTGVAWASGISWGYAIPVLYCFPAVFAVAYFISHIAEFRAPSWYWTGAMVVVLGCMGALNLYVYHDGKRSEITHDLGEVFPKLSHIKAGPEQFANYSELKMLIGKYPQPYTVLPSLPLAHYLTDTKAPLPVDWAHDAEVNYDRGIGKLISTLEASNSMVFVMREELYRAEEDGHYRCSTLRHVLDHWDRVDSTSAFYVYRKGMTANPQ